VVVSSAKVSVAVGAGVAPDVFIRFGAPALLDVRAGRSTFLSVLHSGDAALDGDDAVFVLAATCLHLTDATARASLRRR
jgi:hypothetical protein